MNISSYCPRDLCFCVMIQDFLHGSFCLTFESLLCHICSELCLLLSTLLSIGFLVGTCAYRWYWRLGARLIDSNFFLLRTLTLGRRRTRGESTWYLGGHFLTRRGLTAIGSFTRCTFVSRLVHTIGRVSDQRLIERGPCRYHLLYTALVFSERTLLYFSQ